ncbi:MAG: methylenetetrahydrofolate--tRNA-(uracil(54)-C(5))-methyltransferase (FADH(2)-oxidizing) TrmFO [Clostridia bacterium]|nr:methylenetetrahydrofolate--tRNA-(uracil(54)-C(5))-methyltransferase (FADH(2)-oxidizing) TrmFO [Clostridia bacterium]
MQKVTIIGAGLAGAECAYQLAKRGVEVDLIEMKPSKFTPAHHNPNFAELVCSNSLKNDTLDFATGVLKAEMRALGSFVLQCADEARIPAGNALTVDRDKFAEIVTKRLRAMSNINIIEREAIDFDIDAPTVICAGPLCTDSLSKYIQSLTGESLYFYDAVAPIVSADSIDYNHAFFQDRFGQGEGDYLNCPLNKEEYIAFWEELCKAERVELHTFENEVNFEGCLPVEVMAKRGVDVLRCGPMKPDGIKYNGQTPYAVVQLRRENCAGEMYNLVGFQTNLTFPEQKRIWSMIPALKNAEWLRLGVMHRNTFINAPKYLNHHFQLKTHPNIMFAGQISGVEGYTESVASGLLCGLNMLKYISNQPLIEFGIETCLGALGNYLEAGNPNSFQPMHINWGLLKPIDVPKKDKKQALAKRALSKIAIIKEDLANGI